MFEQLTPVSLQFSLLPDIILHRGDETRGASLLAPFLRCSFGTFMFQALIFIVIISNSFYMKSPSAKLQYKNQCTIIYLMLKNLRIFTYLVEAVLPGRHAFNRKRSFQALQDF